MMSGDDRLVVIAGPTAVGKTRAAVETAKRFSGEVVSCDSMQVYRGLDIGSAKATKEEMQGIPHHMLDIADPKEPFSAAAFQTRAEACIRDIRERGKLPILCGGTGFYIQALIYGTEFSGEPEGDVTKVREPYEEFLREKGAGALHALLAKKDPESAAAIPEQNVKRVLRALEYLGLHGEPISAHNRRETEKREIPVPGLRFFVLYDEREALYHRIDGRVDRMLEEGLLEEVRELREAGVARDATSMQGIGYKELLAYLDGEIPFEEAVRLIKRNSRRYAKRQLTWFRREKNAVWIHVGKEDAVHEIERYL